MQAQPRRTGLRRAAAAGLLVPLVLGAAIAGCGSRDQAQSGRDTAEGNVVDISGTAPLGEETAGSVAPLAQCRDWNRGNEAEKLATIAEIRSQVNSQDSGIEAPALSDEEAMGVFDEGCEPAHAQGFRLYILYARAASFAPLARELP